MNLKYYFRGLGIGIIVTAVLMGVSNKNAVKEAKAEVAMLYQSEDFNLVQETTAVAESTEVQETETIPVLVRNEEIESEISSVLEGAMSEEADKIADETIEAESIVEVKTEKESEEKKSEPKEEKKEPESKESESKEAKESEEDVVVIIPPSEETPAEEAVPTGDTVNIVIAKGDDSGTAARKLHNAGIIENAAEYDAFLMQHGYDKKLSTGTKVINKSDSWQDIAEKLIKN